MFLRSHKGVPTSVAESSWAEGTHSTLVQNPILVNIFLLVLVWCSEILLKAETFSTFLNESKFYARGGSLPFVIDFITDELGTPNIPVLAVLSG